jgi:hypothetical protein
VAAAALAEAETPTPAARLVASETQCRLPPRPQPWTQSQRGALKSAWGSARSPEALATYGAGGGEALRLNERWSDAGAGRVAAVASAATTTAVRVRGARARADGLTSLVRLPVEEDAWEARGELRAALDVRFHRNQDPYPRGCEAHRELWCVGAPKP